MSRILNFLGDVSRTAEQINRSENEPLNFIDIPISGGMGALSQISQDPLDKKKMGGNQKYTNNPRIFFSHYILYTWIYNG